MSLLLQHSADSTEASVVELSQKTCRANTAGLVTCLPWEDQVSVQ